jgi:hypothetical protein
MRLHLRGKRLFAVIALLLLIPFVLYRIVGTSGRMPLSHGSRTPTTLTDTEAAQHVGTYAEVSGVVADVHETADPRGGTTFLDFGATYPSESFTAVIFASDRQRFGNLEGLVGRMVQITGRIERYRGRTEIVLRSPDQMRTLD